MHLLGLNCALGQQVGKASKRIWDEKRENNNNDNNRQKGYFPIFFSNFDLQFPKNDLQFANCEPLFSHETDKGESGAFVVEYRQLV